MVETRATRSHFGENYTAGIVVHAITVGILVAPGQKAKNTIQISINNSTGVINIFTTTIRVTMTECLGHTVKR